MKARFKVGGAVYLRSHSQIAFVIFKSSYFCNGRGVWGVYFELELLFCVVFENNVFLNGVAKEFIPMVQIGLGSTMSMSGFVDPSLTSWKGFGNLYINGWSENKGF